MTGLTKVPLQMLAAVGRPNSDVRFNGLNVVVTPQQEDENDYGISGGTFDATSGTLTLTLRNGAALELQGFMTQGEIGVGPAGPQGAAGRDGRDGLNGIDGDQGSTGCQGPAGPPGRQGPRGEQGLQGSTGPKGATGPTGPDGKDGTVQIWVQTQDPVETSPVHIVAGALWIKP